MIDLLTLEKQFILPHIRKGGTVCDFTMGNGHDTLWLSRQVGENGRVYAFDIQQQAVYSTMQFLQKENAPMNYTLICDSHANAASYVKEKICAGMFNLGYLPGGDKKITTLRTSTMKAVETAVDLLEEGGGLLIAVYPGHEEGNLEGEMLTEYFSSISRFSLCCSCFKIVNSPTSPFFFLIEKREKKEE